MFSVPGKKGRVCDGWTRRELLRVGGCAMLGLSLPEFLSLEALAATPPSAAPGQDGFGNAQSVIVCQVPYPDAGASVFRKRIDCPWWTVGIEVAWARSPAPYS